MLRTVAKKAQIALFIKRHQNLLSMSEQTKRPDNLYLGVGPYPIHQSHVALMNQVPGTWALIDKYIHQYGTKNHDAAYLPYSTHSIKFIYASHLLEHFPFFTVETVLKHWHDLLKPGGTLQLAVPDFSSLCRLYLDLNQPSPKVNSRSLYFREIANYKNQSQNLQAAIFGSQVHDGEIHRCAFSASSLNTVLTQVGFKSITIQSVFDAHQVDCLIAKATI